MVKVLYKNGFMQKNISQQNFVARFLLRWGWHTQRPPSWVGETLLGKTTSAMQDVARKESTFHPIN
jgi:hypothetical protein